MRPNPVSGLAAFFCVEEPKAGFSPRRKAKKRKGRRVLSALKIFLSMVCRGSIDVLAISTGVLRLSIGVFLFGGDWTRFYHRSVEFIHRDPSRERNPKPECRLFAQAKSEEEEGREGSTGVKSFSIDGLQGFYRCFNHFYPRFSASYLSSSTSYRCFLN